MYGYKVLRKFAIVIAATLLASMSPVAEAAKTPRAKSIAGREDAVKNTILNGRGAPKPSLGIDGDFYIDVTTFTIYGPKKGSKWPAGFNLRGPQGEDGKSGERGAAGASGTGSKGEKGERGEKGEKGDKGEAGAVGATGPAGMQGATGAQGPAGPAGVAGATGATGATGSQGPQGLKGDTGDQGPQGVKGDTGDQGVKGDTGTIGPAGPSAVRIVTIDSFTVGTSTSVEYRSGMFGVIERGKSYYFEIVLTGKVATASALGKYFGSYIEGSEAGLTITSTFSSSSGYLLTRSMGAEDVYQFRWSGTVTGAVNSAQLRLVMYHLNSTAIVTVNGVARFQEVGTLN